MLGKLLWRSTKTAMKHRTLRRIALFGALGAGVTAAGVALTGVGVGLAGVALWRRLGLRRQDVRGQVVLITGGSRGLGLALAREFGSLGARLVICARNQSELDLARDQLQRGGADVLALRCDISDSAQVQNMIQQAIERFGRIDILVNNAGIISVGPVASQTMDDFKEAMDIMFWGIVHPTLALLPHMLQRRAGRIANITSIGGKVSVPHLLPYNCAKFAAVGFSEGLRAELAKDGIKVTTVVPWLMRTGSHVNAYFKGDHRTEYNLFSLGATLPVVSMDARRAARRIVNAVRAGQAELILGPQAKLATILHGLFPGLTADALGLVNRLLPANAEVQRHAGKDIQTPVSRSFVTILGRRAGERLNQFPERAAGT
jgi:NAD(P)-dependent dehydrogenase (short-subunit alcohol dehydrogenase family)